MKNSLFIQFVHSLSHAWRGLFVAFKTESSFRIQVAIGLISLLLALMLPLRQWEVVLIVMAIAAVLVLELINSTVERLVDLVKPRLHGYVRDIKDLMAASVLVTSVFAGAIGLYIMWPYLALFLKSL